MYLSLLKDGKVGRIWEEMREEKTVIRIYYMKKPVFKRNKKQMQCTQKASLG